MDSHQLKSKEDTIEFLKGAQIDFEIVDHEAVPTVAAMLEKVKFASETVLAKNLFLKDKKKPDSFYLVVAQHDTIVKNENLAKHFKLGKDNLRNGEPEQMLEVLGITPGSVNLFSIVNDTEEKVKLVLDKKIHDAPRVGIHPMINTSTISAPNELMQYVISLSNHEPEIIDFEALATQILSQEEKKAAEVKKPAQKKVEKGKKEDVHQLGIEFTKAQNFSEWYT